MFYLDERRPSSTMSGPLPTLKEIEIGRDEDGLNSGVSPSSSIHSLTVMEVSAAGSDVVKPQSDGIAEDGLAIHESEVVLDQVRTYVRTHVYVMVANGMQHQITRELCEQLYMTLNCVSFSPCT